MPSCRDGFVWQKGTAVTSAAQLEANRRNAQLSTGPRTLEGKAASSRNAVTHDLRGRAPIAITRGPFAEDAGEVQDFVEAVVAELEPVGAQELAEAVAIAGLHVRRRRLHELEAIALSGTTKARLLPPAEPGGPSRVTYEDQERAAAQALDCGLLRQLPRYEAHLSRELDRSLIRLRHMQERRLQHMVIDGSHS